jgi:hypothetical protein
MPFSADEIGDEVRILPDGRQIAMPSKTRIYRDSAGRTRMERSLPAHPGQGKPDGATARVVIWISDPVAHVFYSYLLNSADKAALKRDFRTAPPAPAGTPAALPPNTTVEELGSQTIDGIPVKGTRRTTIWPAGSRHNDQPITAVTETWASPDLRLPPVLLKHSDPIGGSFTRKLTNISRAEPDPSLFRLPADYTVTDVAALRSAHLRRAPAAPVATSAAAAPPPPPPLEPMRPEPAAEPEPAPSEASAIEESPDDSSFADAPPADIPQADSAAGYVGVNPVFVGVHQANPPAAQTAAVTNTSKPVAAPASGSTPPKKLVPKVPAPEKPVQ